MNAEELRSLQAPLKAQYRENPETALVTLRAEGRIGENITCKIETGKARVEAGLHPATGGDGLCAWSLPLLASRYATPRFALRAISIFAALWESQKMHRLASIKFDCISI